MYNKLAILSILLFLVISLTGCWDSNQPDRMVFAQSLGIDYKDGKYIVYIQLMNLSMLAKSDSGGGGGKPIKSEIGRSTGKSFEEAVYNIYKTSQRRIHWGHLNYILLTENALRHNGLQNVTELIDRYFETHYRIWIFSTNDKLANIMNTDPPINMSTYLSRLSDPDAAFNQFSFIQSIDLREMIITHNEPPNEIIIPYVIQNNKDWIGEKEARNIEEINGISVITYNSFKGSIKNNDVNGLRWIQKKFKRTIISIQQKENKSIGLTIKKRKVHIDPIIKNGKLQFDLSIKTKAVINKLEINTPVEEISREAKKLIKKEVKNTYEKGLELDTDIYRLSNILYRKNFPEWKKIQKDGKIPLTKDSIRNIKVEVTITDGGKQHKVPTLD